VANRWAPWLELLGDGATVATVNAVGALVDQANATLTVTAKIATRLIFTYCADFRCDVFVAGCQVVSFMQADAGAGFAEITNCRALFVPTAVNERITAAGTCVYDVPQGATVAFKLTSSLTAGAGATFTIRANTRVSVVALPLDGITS
jgi:hypothetical protein